MESKTQYTSSSSKYDTNLSLKQQVMLNQFISITGCSYEQAYQLLLSANWQYQTALSIFFGDIASIVPQQTSNNCCCHNHLCLCAPSNTPVTPPNLEYLENAFAKLNSNLNKNSSNSSMDVSFSNNNSNSLDSSNSNSTENMFYLQTNNTHKSTTSSIDIQNKQNYNPNDNSNNYNNNNNNNNNNSTSNFMF